MEYSKEREPPAVITSDTENATKIQPKEAPPEKRAKFRRFRAYNTGTWNGPKRENKKIVHRQDNIQRYDAISSTLELTQVQKSQGREIFDSLDLGEFNKGNEDIDHVIFGLCVLIANKDVRGGTRHWPHPDNSQTDSIFMDFAKSIGLSLNEQMSIVQRVRSRVNL